MISILFQFGVWFLFLCLFQVLCLDADVATMGFRWWLAFSVLGFGIWNMLLTTWAWISDSGFDFGLWSCLCCYVFSWNLRLGNWFKFVNFDVGLDFELCSVRISIMSWMLVHMFMFGICVELGSFFLIWMLNRFCKCVVCVWALLIN